METRVNYSGLVIAGIGFFLTRFTVTLALYEESIRFYLAGVVPLALGLGLAAFGVAMAVADVDSAVVRTTALWCVAGTSGMLVLVGLTVVASTSGDPVDVGSIRSRAYFSTFLIGGSVGGTLTGLYAAHNRHQRTALGQQARRLEVLNRLLRHEVLNAVSVIRGYASLRENGGADAGGTDAGAVIEEYAADIEDTIEEVKYLTRNVGTDGTSTVDVAACLARSVDAVRERHPDAAVSVGEVPDGLAVRADDSLERVFVDLLENAVVHGAGDEPVDVTVTTRGERVRVSVHDDGPGLPEKQQRLLETGEIERYDDPESGFGLNIVRILVERYAGAVETAVGDDGTTVTVVLPRATDGDVAFRENRSSVTGVTPSTPHLVVTFGAAIVAGVVYGGVAELLGGSVAFIGVYYGIQNAVVGWLTHEFHSVVFAFVFAGLVSLAPADRRTDVSTHVAIGVAWGVTLWLLAAGVVAPVWLRLLDFPATIPNVSSMLLATHVSWGVSLGLLTAWGYRTVVPWLSRVGSPRVRRFRLR